MSAGRGADAGSRVPSDSESVGSDGVGVDREDSGSPESIPVDILNRFEPFEAHETSASFVGVKGSSPVFISSYLLCDRT
jgi:hypothetical protein